MMMETIAGKGVPAISARTFSHLSITVLLLLLARHVHVRRHSMHIFA